MGYVAIHLYMQRLKTDARLLFYQMGMLSGVPAHHMLSALPSPPNLAGILPSPTSTSICSSLEYVHWMLIPLSPYSQHASSP